MIKVNKDMEDIEQTIKEQYNAEHPASGELRYSPVIFYDDKVADETLRHTYWLRNKQLKGVTGTLIDKAFPKMYEGVSKEKLNERAENGNYIHDMVQENLLYGGDCYTAEEVNAQHIVTENGLTILDTEYLVSDEKHFASAIDLVALDKDGDIILIDIKTTSVRHYDNVSLQLSIYADWFERQNPGMKVKGLWLMWLKGGEYAFDQVPRVDRRKIKRLIMAYLKDDDAYVYDNNPRWLNQRSKEMSRLMQQIDELTAKLDALKESTLHQMSDEHYYTLRGNGITISKVAASQSPRFNSKALQQDNPELYGKYLQMTNKKEYITIKRNK